MQNNNTLPEKIDGYYFWNGDVTFEVSTEAAQRWNNYPELVEALKGFVSIMDAFTGVIPPLANDEGYKKAKTLLETLNRK